MYGYYYVTENINRKDIENKAKKKKDENKFVFGRGRQDKVIVFVLYLVMVDKTE